ADAFDIANTLPTMLFALVSAGAIQSVLMPQIMSAIRAENAQERLDKLLTLAVVTLAVLTALLVVAVPLLIRAFTLVGDWPAEQLALAVVFGYWCIPQVFFYGLFTVLGDMLSARGQFGAFGWAPVANNIISIIGFGAFVWTWGSARTELPELAAWTGGQTALLAGTATLGIVVQALILVVALRRGGFPWRLRFGLRGIGLRTASRVVGWTLGAVALEQVGVLYLRNVMAAAGADATAAGSVAAGNATYSSVLLIYLLPHSILMVPIITALFPRLSASAAAGDLRAVRADLSTGLRLAAVVTVFAATVVLVLAGPLMKAVLPTASVEMIEVGIPVLQAMAPGLVALGATILVKRMYFALGDGRSVFVIQILATTTSVLMVFAATQVLESSWWTVAAAAAGSVAAWISVLARVRGMRRKLDGIDGHRVLRVYVRAGVASLVAGGAGLALMSRVPDPAALTWVNALGVTAGTGLVMVVLYVGGLRVMRVTEIDMALAPVLRRLRRK
ncbi:MAG: murein biosynthesis protein MurJ, partial [Actinomycetota bacterium]|nr:murein biosynthesis protein MurJ [Actinomycetota bacterium]